MSSPPSQHQTVEVSFPSSLSHADGGTPASVQLAGSLRIPTTTTDTTARLPALLILSGSGNVDRDGNVKHWLTGQTLNIYNRLADELTRVSGFATLCFDKRGIGKSVVSPDDKNAFFRAGLWDLLDDAVGAYAFLATHSRVDPNRIFVLGHSEGAMLAYPLFSRVAAAGLAKPPAGLVCLSGFGQTLPESTAYQRSLLRDEVEHATGLKGFILRLVLSPKKIEDQAKAGIDAAFKEPLVDYQSQMFGIVKVPSKWWREHWIYGGERAPPGEPDSAKKNGMIQDAANVTCHVLAIVGAKDCQVITDEAHSDARLAQWVPNAASRQATIVPDVNHILRQQAGPKSILDIKQQYAVGAHQPVDKYLVQVIADWLASRP